MRLIDADRLYDDMLYAMCGTGYQTRALDIINFAPEIPQETLLGELRKRQWISVKDRLPKAEVEVLVAVEHEYSPVPTITTAIYEDGTVLNEDSCWNWTDIDFDYDENEEELVPQGWWEYRHYNPDDVYNNCIDGQVTHWMPLPEPPKTGDVDD